MSKLRIFIKEKSIQTLGPGNRYGIWVQGCNRRCSGCVAEQSQPLNGGTLVDVGGLAWEIICSDVEGLTISGGEPFLQADALTELITLIRAKKDIGVIVYTGYLREELKNVPGGDSFLQQIDLLIDGPYKRELDDGKSLRGSSNQRVIALTDRYQDYLHMYGTEGRKTEVFKHGDTINIVGIPNRENPKE